MQSRYCLHKTPGFLNWHNHRPKDAQSPAALAGRYLIWLPVDRRDYPVRQSRWNQTPLWRPLKIGTALRLWRRWIVSCYVRLWDSIVTLPYLLIGRVDVALTPRDRIECVEASALEGCCDIKCYCGDVPLLYRVSSSILVGPGRISYRRYWNRNRTVTTIEEPDCYEITFWGREVCVCDDKVLI